MTTPHEELHRNLQDPGFRRLYGTAAAKTEAGYMLTALAKEQGLAGNDLARFLRIHGRTVDALSLGEANPCIGELGEWLAALGWRVRMTVEPLEKEGSE